MNKNTNENPNDNELITLKKRARRRLVGAVVLALTTVIVLPMILDRSPASTNPSVGDVVITIPSQVPLSPLVTAHEAHDPRAVEGLELHEEVIQPAPATPPPITSAPSVPPPVSSTTSASSISPPAKPPVNETIHSAPKTAPKSARYAEDEKRALAILEGRDAPSKTPRSPSAPIIRTVPTGNITLQVAALASMDKVNALRAKLTAAGIASHTQTITTAEGERIRVRIGPFANQGEADKAQASLSRLGLTASVIR